MKQKTTRETQTIEKIYYESDDGCFKSDNKDEVAQYEREIHLAKPELIKHLYLADSEELSGCAIYHCETKWDLYKAIAIETRGEHISYCEIEEAVNKFTNSQKFYVIKCEPACGDNWYGDLLLWHINDFIADFKGVIQEQQKALIDLEDTFAELEEDLQESKNKAILSELQGCCFAPEECIKECFKEHNAEILAGKYIPVGISKRDYECMLKALNTQYKIDGGDTDGRN